MPNLDAANILFNVLKVTGGKGITVGVTTEEALGRAVALAAQPALELLGRPRLPARVVVHGCLVSCFSAPAPVSCPPARG